jgi:hypothetical protein
MDEKLRGVRAVIEKKHFPGASVKKAL